MCVCMRAQALSGRATGEAFPWGWGRGDREPDPLPARHRAVNLSRLWVGENLRQETRG